MTLAISGVAVTYTSHVLNGVYIDACEMAACRLAATERCVSIVTVDLR